MKLPTLAITAGILLLVLHTEANALDNFNTLVDFTGTYQLSKGEYPACQQRPHVELEYQPASKLLAVNPSDKQKRERGWQWLSFGPLNGGSQMLENNFGATKHVSAVAVKTDLGWQIEQRVKSCKLRFLCGPWTVQNSISLNRNIMIVHLLAGTYQCSYQRS